MNIKTIGALFVLFSLIAAMPVTQAFGDHAKASVDIPAGTSILGCEVDNMCYIPSVVSIDKGGEVTWTNSDTAVHTVTSGTPTDGPDGMFDSSIINSGSTFSFSGFTKAGEYDYFCIVHPWMKGVVTVAAAMEDDGNGHHDDDMKIIPDTTPAVMMSKDGMYMVKVYPNGEPITGETFGFTVLVTDSDGNSVEHVNYDVMAQQDGISLVEDMGVHAHKGMQEHTTSALDSDSAVNVMVTLQGFGTGEPSTRTGPMGETLEFNVIPEFGTVAILVFAVAIISIVAVTAKSKTLITSRL